jgi:hypothetical protein
MTDKFWDSRHKSKAKSESEIPRQSKKQCLSQKDMTLSSSYHDDEALQKTNRTLAFIIQSSQENMLMPWMSMLSVVLKGFVV